LYSLLLAVIYLAFVSLGLPEALLGSAWPVMQPEMGVPLSFAGIISMATTAGIITSVLLSHRLTRKFGAGPVAAAGVLATAAALLGFSAAGSFWALCALAVPYGLGSGAVDASINGVVASRYAPRHMSWLHCFWGVGASISPHIMGWHLAGGAGWGGGYRTVALIQIAMAAALFLSLPLWKERGAAAKAAPGDPPPPPTPPAAPPAAPGLSHIVKIRGVGFVLPALFAYCAMESTAGLWASSYLVLHKGIAPETSARYASLFYLGITAGRFLCGFAADRAGGRNMVRIGLATAAAGILAVLLPAAFDGMALAGLIVIGLGCAPVFPSIMHAAPASFGRENAQAIIGVQMASAYVGMTLAPPLFGLVAGSAGIGLYPAFLLAFAAPALFLTEKLNKAIGRGA